jgi:hypothetical protein
VEMYFLSLYMPSRHDRDGQTTLASALPISSAVCRSNFADVFDREAVQIFADPPNNWIDFFIVFFTDHPFSLQQQPFLTAATSAVLPTKLNVKLSLCKP